MLAEFVVNALVVMVVVMFHYECLHQMSRHLPRIRLRPRFKIVVGVMGALVAHAVEVWIFALVYYVSIHLQWGLLSDGSVDSLLDCVYFSFTVFTTLGFGDITPHGSLRFLTGIESLSGLVLITWTASFLYIEMQKYWEDEVL
jgi:Ion channel